MKVPKGSKCSIFCLFLLILPLLSLGQSAQGFRVSNKPLKQVLNDLEKQFPVYFSFNPNELKTKRVSADGSNNDLESILSEVLAETDLVFEKIKGKFYVIKTPEAKFIHLSILDEENNAPLPYATIRLQGTLLGQVADDAGDIKLVLPKPKDAVLEISFLGFQTHSIPVSNINDNEAFQVALKPSPLGLTDFEVKEYINVGIGSDPKANSFRVLPQEMEILPGLSERDVLLSAQIISGLTSNDESASGINIRGSAPDNTLLYWNNVPVYHTAHYFGNVSSFIPSSTGALDIYKNYIPVRYGGASAGLISISSRNEIDGKTNAEASLNMTHADVYAKVPFKKDFGSIMVAFRRSYNDVIPTYTFNSYSTKLFGSETDDGLGIFQVTEDENDFENDLSFTDINVKWDYQPNDRSLFSASLVNNRSSFKYSEEEEEEDINIRQQHDVKSFGANLGWSYRLKDDFSITSSLSYSQYSMAYRFNNLRNFIILGDDDEVNRSNDLNNLEFRLSNHWRSSENSVLEFGYQMNRFDVKNRIDASDFFEEDELTDIRSTGFVHALFADYNYRPSDKLEAVFSGRLTNVGTLGESFFSPQIKLNFNPIKALVFKSSFGIYHQYLSTIQESEFTLSNAVEQHWLLSDVNSDEEEISTVPIIINRQLTLGLLYNLDSWLIDLDFYIKDIDGILATNQRFGFENDEAFEPGFELLNGFDLTIRKRWKHFRSWFSYNFQDSRVELPEIIDGSFASSFNIRHQFRLSATYNVKNWEFSIGYIFKTGLPITNKNNLIVVDSDDNVVPLNTPGAFDEDEEYDIIFSTPNDARAPDYHRVDFSIWHKFGEQSKKVKGEIGLSIINLLDRRNIFNSTYSLDFDRDENLAILERTKFFLGFTPNVSLRLWF
ncbi:carboxypeptidase-like regulatory domain-containing protein [Roseivirga sp.]|uniref:carboxypeptidase-like regulatory domain-containing protein n=1 Tax=Roseivirga sp. TaxID=1964215 RepID=UPI003B8BDD54